MALKKALIDSGPIAAYYNKTDHWHAAARIFFESYDGALITSVAVCTEVMWLLSTDRRVQNEFLNDVSLKIYDLEHLTNADFGYISKMNEKYKNVPGDFADLSIIAIAERLGLVNVVSLDADFDIYRLRGNKRLNQIFPQW